jgi:putative SOS response-associated peptidase YedK
MCYSAEVEAEYKLYVREWGATMSIKEYFDIFWRRRSDPSIVIPKSMEAPFASPTSPEEFRIKELIDEFNLQQVAKFETEFFTQRTRLIDAQRKLVTKVTKSAQESERIANNKIARAQAKLDDLRRTQIEPRDGRIYPANYAPVMVLRDGQRKLVPMRYLCRLPDKPVFYDTKYPGTYNARRDSLDNFWKPVFGVSHGVLVVNAFYENVAVSGPDGAPANTVLQFRPQSGDPMLVACVWAHWTAPGHGDLLSFAVITDEPPPEVAAAGHNRCPIAIKPESMDDWLSPSLGALQRQQEILDDKQPFYYEHRQAA